MPSSTLRIFTDPDAFHTGIRNLKVEGVVTAGGDYRVDLARIDLHRLWMHRGEESLPRILSYTPGGNRATLLFASDSDQPAVHVRGVEVANNEITMIGFHSTDHYRTSAPHRWGAMSLTLDDLATAGHTISGRELKARPDTSFIKPAPSFLSGLRNLHQAVGHLAKTAPELLAASEVARAMEQGLVEAMVFCLASGNSLEVRNVSVHRATVMRRLEGVLEAACDEPLYMADLCRAVGVSYPTLRACCQEHLGMGPKRYLLLRRMHLARRALRRAVPGERTVTEIATNYGFWELGRFSVAYRSLFGELPLATLRRTPEDPKGDKTEAPLRQFTKIA